MGPHERARALILAHGRNATSYQILNPGFFLWFNSDDSAVVGYAEHHGVRVVAGIPICEEAIMRGVVAEFEAQAARDRFDVAYFCVERRSIPIWLDDPARATIVVGAQPVWKPASLVHAMRTFPALRAQLNRASNKGVRTERWNAERAGSSSELRACLGEWLDRRGLPPLRFLVEPDTLPRLLDRHVFVALRDNHAVGFLVIAPIPERHGWLIEQSVRGDTAPNGTIEALLFAAAEWMCDNGDAMVTLGLSPLSVHAPPSEVTPSRSVRALFAWLRIHGRRFYNFEGLDSFKAKFRPDEWEPVYAVVNRRGRMWKGLIAIGAAFGGTSVIPFAGQVLRHAIAQEVTRVRRRIQ